VRFGFQYSHVSGFTREWQPIDNPAHIVNIRVWLSLIEQNPEWFDTLLSALIINIKLTGTCIRDTDLFQKEVTRLLNSNVSPVYNLVKQFAKLLPVYYNDIGAEGLLREVSTERFDQLQGCLRIFFYIALEKLKGFKEEFFDFFVALAAHHLHQCAVNFFEGTLMEHQKPLSFHNSKQIA
jgi:pyruvate,orthophosphate dikinase